MGKYGLIAFISLTLFVPVIGNASVLQIGAPSSGTFGVDVPDPPVGPPGGVFPPGATWTTSICESGTAQSWNYEWVVSQSSTHTDFGKWVLMGWSTFKKPCMVT